MRAATQKLMASEKGLSIVVLLIAMFSIQSGASLAKSLFPIFGAQGMSAFRLGFAALILVLVWRPWRGGLNREMLKSTFFYGTSLGAMNLLFYMSVSRIPLGIAVALEFTGPLAMALWSSRKWQDFVWALLAILGIVMILPLQAHTADLDLLGAFYAVAAGVFWALYIVFGQKAGDAVHGGKATALGMFFAAVLVVPIGVTKLDPSVLLDPKLISLAFSVAILSSALPYSLEMIALKRIPAKNFSILMSLEPAIGALMGLIFLKEFLTFQQWLAIACIVAASAGSAISAEPKVVLGSDAA